VEQFHLGGTWRSPEGVASIANMLRPPLRLPGIFDRRLLRDGGTNEKLLLALSDASGLPLWGRAKHSEDPRLPNSVLIYNGYFRPYTVCVKVYNPQGRRNGRLTVAIGSARDRDKLEQMKEHYEIIRR